MWVSSLRRPTPTYQPEDGSYRAVAAPLWRRAAASTLDWVLIFFVYLIVGIPLGMIQTLGETLGGAVGETLFWLTQALALSVVLAYFAYFFSTGHTLGMRAFDIHIFGYVTGRDPHPVRATVRSLLALGFFLGSINGYGLLRGVHDDGLTPLEETWRALALSGIAVVVAGHLWKLADPEGRSIWDRLTGLVVVEDVVPATMPDRLWSPWGT